MSQSPMDHLRVLHRQLGGMVRRGTVTGCNDSAKCQTVQVKIAADDCTLDVEHFQPYGFTSQALAGAEAIVASIEGNADHLVALAVTDRRKRPKVAAGESAQWDDQGQIIAIRRDGIVIDWNGGGRGLKLGAAASLGVARRTDAVSLTLDNEAMGAIAAGVAPMLAWVGAGNPPSTFTPPFAIPATGTITGGSGTVTAAD